MRTYLINNEEIRKALSDKRLYVMIGIAVFIGVLISDNAIFHNFVYFITGHKERMYSLSEWNEHFKRLFRPEIIIFFLILAPFSLSLFEERKSKTINIICIRQPFRIYFIKKIVAVSVVAAISYLLYTFLSAAIFMLIEYLEKGYITNGFYGRIYWVMPDAFHPNDYIWLDRLGSVQVLIIGALIFSLKAAAYGCLALISSYYFKYDKYLVLLLAYMIYKTSFLLYELTPDSMLDMQIPPIVDAFLDFQGWFGLNLVYVGQGEFDVLPEAIGIAVLLLASVLLYRKINKSEVMD